MKNKKYSEKIKLKVKSLRSKQGLSYNEIATKMSVSKSAIASWCKDVILKPEHKERLYTKQIELLSKGPHSSHERRKKEIALIAKNGKEEIILPLKTETYKLIGAALYWAEGNKKTHFAVTNSDPHLIKFIVHWLKDTLNTNPKNIKAHLNIYPQQNESLIKKFWSEITGIPLKNFGKSFVKPVNKNYKKNTLYYGTIKIRVFKGTDLRHRVFGWISAILQNNKTEIDKVERKWHKLKIDYPRP